MFKNFLAGECENDAECTTSQACFNFKCKDSCQDACGIGAQCKPVNHGKSNTIWSNIPKQMKKMRKREKNSWFLIGESIEPFKNPFKSFAWV